MANTYSLPFMRLSPLRLKRFSTVEFPLLVFVFLMGIVMAWYVYQSGLTKALTDQSSHLNFSRLTFDSLTPGVSQLGFWPPLLHILMIPFVAVPLLYSTGLAGAFVLVPCLMICVFLLYRITLRLTKSETMGLVAGVLFVLNPYILYYSVTPMMEILFMTNLFAVAYFLLGWLDTGKLHTLLLTGLFITLACLSRFEGFLLLPIVGSIVLIELVRRRKKYAEMEALLILFGVLAVIGVFLVMLYSWVYGHNPLAFTGGDWLRDPAASLRPARFNLLNTFRDAMAASYYIIGQPLVVISGASFLGLLAVQHRRLQPYATLFVLGSPLIFVFIALYTGSITINVPELPPYNIFHNDRYSLTWLGFAVLAPILLFHEFERMTGARVWLHSFIRSLGRVLLGLLIIFMAYQFIRIVFIGHFDVIRRNFNSPVAAQIEVADYLKAHYTNGKVLSARVDNDPIFAAAGVPLNDYIYEGNYRYFDQVMKEPWFFAQWVIMHDPTKQRDDWAKQHEPVLRQWGDSKEFTQYYDLVLQNGERRLYKLNENHLLQAVKKRGYSVSTIPALNPALSNWNPSTVYATMREPQPIKLTAQELADSKGTVKSELLDFYWNRLKPDFENGYYLDENRKGNTESQSYAMMQALRVDDPETFDRVWQWTKTHLRRPDGLFAWKFTVDAAGRAVIDDSNSATDADTDMANTLLLAGQRWAKPAYIADAKPIIAGIWSRETAVSDSGRHVIAGNWASESGTLVINPSYFSPQAYRLFAQFDPSHDWQGVIQTGYQDLLAGSQLVESQKGKYMPPDWMQLDLSTNTYAPFSAKPGSLDVSFDAFRTLWRVAQDSTTSHDPAASSYLSKITAYDTEWNSDNRLCNLYIFSSTTDTCHFDMGSLAAPVSVWTVTNPSQAKSVLESFVFAPGELRLPNSSSFYEKSWYWFMLWQWSHTENANGITV